MTGTAHLTLPPQEELTVSLKGITVTGILLNRNGKEALTMPIPASEELTLPASTQGVQEIFISYAKTVGRSHENRIMEDGIVLTGHWYPQPDKDMFYTLDANVPEGFIAIAESDYLTFETGSNLQTFSLSQPLAGIHFVAAPYKVSHLQLRKGLRISTLFFDEPLAEEYLQATANYIKRYEAQLGPFPYDHYVIVENHLPTGYGMPTFTLLGSAVIRLPFIKDTSLGHEVLHSWFGNSIGVDTADGNWCEGLTSYLADWTFREEKGEGAQNRKENILGYLSYVAEEHAIPLEEFSSASHRQPMARAIRAVGYTRAAMLFHELKLHIGEEPFRDGLRLIIDSHSGNKASWNDLQRAFESISGKDLAIFFSERLSRKDIPALSAKNLTTHSLNGKVRFSFDIVQNTLPFTLNVPLLVTTAETKLHTTVKVSEVKTTINLDLPDPPLSLTVDPGYDLMRRLDSSETSPILSGFMGADKKLIVLTSKEETIFAPLLQHYKSKDWQIVRAKDVKNSDLANTSLLFLGKDNSVSRSLFGMVGQPNKGFTLEVRTNPLNNKYVAVLITSENNKETQAVVRRLPHYGKYSYLHFENGRILQKKIQPSNFGDYYELEQLPMGASVNSFNSFADIVNELSQKRVVYVGESHTSYGDHLLQFRLIQELYKRNSNLAIGMEMFPTTSQEALDEYILDDKKISEEGFLKKSRYFEVWRYDWRFFRDIFSFAKKNKIPVRGINLERNIVSQVFKEGSTDGLTDVIKTKLPVDRDLSIQGYWDRLENMHGLHTQGGHGSGMMSGFIQAQGLWDETMAQEIAEYLKENPHDSMVVLAGSEHTRKDSGIPPRVARRLNISQASVINVSEGDNLSYIKNIADYYFMAPEQRLPSEAKIGIVLDQKEKNNQNFLEIIQLSPHGYAGKAGLQEKDILLAINDYPTLEMVDVRIAMIGAQEGDIVSLRIRRSDANFEDEELSLQVKLYLPKGESPHP